MNEELNQTTALIRETIETALIDYKEALVVVPREGENQSVYWTIQTHADDYRKVCGIRGAHIKALTFLIAEIGATAGAEYKTWLKEPTVGEKLPMRPIDPVDAYDPREARDLLCRLLTALLGIETPFAVNVAFDGSRIKVPPFSLLFEFQITVRSSDDHDRMTLPVDGDREERTVVGSLSELFRAYAAKAGVAFALKVLPLTPPLPWEK